MDSTTLFLVGLFLLVACAVLVGELFSRFGQAALVGQLLVGIVIGPTFLGSLLGFSSLATPFSGLQFLATFFILMTAGLAVTPQQIRSTGRPAALLGVAIFVAPFLTGTLVVHLLYPGLSIMTALFVSLTISITALPVLAIMLREFGLFRSRFGTVLMNTSLVNELAAVTVFAVLLRVQGNLGSPLLAVVTAVVTVALFLSSVLLVHMALVSLRRVRVWGRMAERFRETWRIPEAGFAVLMVVALGAALYSQFLGLTFLVGAFYAGILVTPESAGRRQHRTISLVFEAVTWGFFIPLFFALVGFGMDLRSLATSPATLLVFALLGAFAFLSKVAAGSLVARGLGWTRDESLGAGFLVSSRGAVELAMAVILLDQGIFSRTIYTVVAGVGLVTTFLAPIGSKPFVRSIPAERRKADEESANAPLEAWIPPPDF